MLRKKHLTHWFVTLVSLILLCIGFVKIANNYNITKFKYDNETKESLFCESYFRKKAPRILCTIFTKREVHSTKMKAIHETWSKRCDIRLYMTGPKMPNDSKDDPTMPFVYLNITDTLERLTDKHIGTIMHVYEHYMNKFDWFLYANDDTFIAIENLKLFVQDKCPNEKKLYGKVMIYAQTQKVRLKC
jgi:glycoprotein-N-acetylgalactosamine 3-beta-galactosyltransferase